MDRLREALTQILIRASPGDNSLVLDECATIARSALAAEPASGRADIDALVEMCVDAYYKFGVATEEEAKRNLAAEPASVEADRGFAGLPERYQATTAGAAPPPQGEEEIVARVEEWIEHPTLRRELRLDDLRALIALAAKPASGGRRVLVRFDDDGETLHQRVLTEAQYKAAVAPPPPPTQGEEEAARELLNYILDATWTPIEPVVAHVAAALRQRADEAREECAKIAEACGPCESPKSVAAAIRTRITPEG